MSHAHSRGNDVMSYHTQKEAQSALRLSPSSASSQNHRSLSSSYNHLNFISIMPRKSLTKVVYKPDTQSTDEFTVIVNLEEVCTTRRSTSHDPCLHG